MLNNLSKLFFQSKDISEKNNYEVNKWIFTGGGVRNETLMNDLKHLFKLIRFKNLMIIVSIQLLIKFCIVNQFVDNYSLNWIEFLLYFD